MQAFIAKTLVIATLGFAAALPIRAQTRAAEPLDSFPRSELAIATPDARLHRFKVWIADTNFRREQGLMFVKSLADNEGMLFVYPAPQTISMWMKNTFIPLDMIFIRPNGKVARVVANTKPHSLDIIESKEPVLAVLELKGGTAARLGIRAGVSVRHHAFRGP